MGGYPPLLRWLATAAAADWLIGRTLTRAAIFMPKAGPVLFTYQTLSVVGQVAMTTTGLLAHAGLLWVAWTLHRGSQRLLPVVIALLTLLNIAGLFTAPSAELGLAYHLLVLTGLLALAVHALKRSLGWSHSLAFVLPTGALIAGELYSAAAALPVALGRSGPSGMGLLFFNLGELLVVGSGLAFGGWLALRGPVRWTWLIAALPALAFALVFSVQPALTGVMAIWSVGLTLYLPWPLYALSLWACAAAALAGLRRRHPAGLAIPLLMAGGYAPQLSTHLALGLIALWLLSQGEGQLLTQEQGQPGAACSAAPTLGPGARPAARRSSTSVS